MATIKDLNMGKAKEPVTLREKPLKNGNTSLYLDIYHNGKRKYEYLKLYIVEAHSLLEKEQNDATWLLAQTIKAQRVVEINTGKYDIKLADRDKVPFFSFFDKMCEELESRKGHLWKSVRKLILAYCGDEAITFRDIDSQFVSGLREYIDTKEHRADAMRGKGLSHGTKNIYWAIIKAVLKKAIVDGIIDKSPADSLPGFKASEPRRLYLTADEVRMLSQTACRREDVKKAFLFSCLTGLRHSDVEALTWGDVTEENGYTRITFRQQKTKWQEYLDVNKQAASLMGERQAPGEQVFPMPYSTDHISRVLKEWAKDAGVAKSISFHVARHSFATMMLGNGVELYTVSKLLGHRSISTTQVYAKIMDRDKQRAVDSMPDILG